jgi:hypothetical protein
MEARIPIDMAQEGPLARRDRAIEAIRRYRPMSIWGQVVVLGFASAMVLLVLFASLLRPVLNPSLYWAVSLLTTIFFVAANAMLSQRRLNALVELVMQNLDKP